MLFFFSFFLFYTFPPHCKACNIRYSTRELSKQVLIQWKSVHHKVPLFLNTGSVICYWNMQMQILSLYISILHSVRICQRWTKRMKYLIFQRMFWMMKIFEYSWDFLLLMQVFNLLVYSSNAWKESRWCSSSLNRICRFFSVCRILKL